MKNSTKIAIIVGFSTLILGGTIYFFYKRKQKKVKESLLKKVIEIPNAYQNNALIKKVKDKTDYIQGTLDMMTLKNGVIVSTKNGTPNSIGLLQGVWRMHNEEFNKQKNIINSSSDTSQVKDFAKRLVENVENRNIALFNPKDYNYEAKWYKDYLLKKL